MNNSITLFKETFSGKTKKLAILAIQNSSNDRSAILGRYRTLHGQD